MRRVHVFISGRVQGVAFRHYTVKTALSLNLKGWVQNLDDGRVEAVFEGSDAHVDALLAWCGRGPSLAHVTHVDIQEEPFSGQYEDFKIRY
ncbi:MAG: acylphosphatase [Pseudomonadota bacterium]